MSFLESALIQSVLDTPMLSRIRRNHGLEHATLHILARQYPQKAMGGHSNPGGFVLMGDISIEDIQTAAEEALTRMKAGEHHLAVHPGCGTNFATAGTLAGLVAALGMWNAGSRQRDKLERLPLVATLATLALIIAQPLGMRLQKYITTSGHPGDLHIVAIQRLSSGRITAHRVTTRG